MLSSVAVLAVLSKPVTAQVSAQGADHAVTLDTLSVDGTGGRPSASGADAGGPVGPVRGYTATRSVVGTKTDTPILETAQSISVVSRKQIEDQNALTINQALRYTPSVTTEQRGGSGSTRLEQFLIRGFTAPLFLDGMRLPSSRDAGPSVDPFRLERVDIIKGPASVLYGQAGPGGIVNLVSKVPSFVRHGEIFIQGGDYNTVRGGVDVGGPVEGHGVLADQFAYRIIAAGWNADGPARTTSIERSFINPSVTWRPSSDTSLTVIGLYQRDPYSGYYGALPAKGTLFPSNFGIANGPLGRLPRDFYDGDPNIERSDRTQASATYIFDHRFDEGIRVHSSGRFLRTLGDYRSLYDAISNNLAWNGRFLGRAAGGTNVAIDAFTNDNNLVANFETGPVAHTVLVGLDHQTLYTKTYSTPFPPVPQSLDLLNPVYGLPNIPFPAFSGYSDITAQQTGIYFQDQIKVDRLTLTLGGRYDWASQTGPTRDMTGKVISEQNAPSEAFTGRASLLYLFDSGVAPYVSYSEAFEPLVSGQIYNGNPTFGRLPDPITSRQFEVGVKYQPPGTDILLTAAAFDIKRQNSLSPDPNRLNFSVQTGEVSVQGVEFEARANVTENLTLVGGFSLIDAVNSAGTSKTLNETTGQNVELLGLRPIQVPDTTISLFGNYQVRTGVFAGLGFGGGFRYLGGSQGDAANSFKVPANLVVDAVASYDFGYLSPNLKGVQLQVNAQNLLDETYVQSCAYQAWCWYGAPRTVLATLRYRW